MTSQPRIVFSDQAAPASDGWGATLSMRLARRHQRTALCSLRHEGPLRVQRPFYPEGEALPHIYLLHPPGGMVPGDHLDIDITVDSGASALVTTPASGKVYDVGERLLPQCQNLHVQVADGGSLEWLPQDTVFFNGARYAGNTHIQLRGDARLMVWDVATLGRRAGNFPFLEGSISQRLQIWRDDVPLYLERFALDAADAMLDAPWGLGGVRTWGVALATYRPDVALLEVLRECAAKVTNARASVTVMKHLLVARYLGDCPLQALRYFEAVRSLLRPGMLGREACTPRVWAT